MTVFMDKTVNGADVIRTNSADVGAGSRTKSLPADFILIRASDGHVFTAEPKSLSRLSPAQVEMVEHFLAERGMSAPHVFAGQPARAAKKPHR